MVFEQGPQHGGGSFMLGDHAGNEVTVIGDFHAFALQLRDHVVMQGEQLGKHVVRIVAGERNGGGQGGPHHGEDLIHGLGEGVGAEAAG